MRTKALLPVIALCAAIGLIGLGGCGGGDDNGDGSASDSTATTTVTEDGTTTETETGDDSNTGNAPAPSGDAVRSAKVEIEDYAYNPDPVTIEEGGKVTWINKDSVAHTATADDGSFDTGAIEEGKLKSETFKQPGTYDYICSIHPTMHGTIEVVEAG